MCQWIPIWKQLNWQSKGGKLSLLIIWQSEEIILDISYYQRVSNLRHFWLMTPLNKEQRALGRLPRKRKLYRSKIIWILNILENQRDLPPIPWDNTDDSLMTETKLINSFNNWHYRVYNRIIKNIYVCNILRIDGLSHGTFSCIFHFYCIQKWEYHKVLSIHIIKYYNSLN